VVTPDLSGIVWITSREEAELRAVVDQARRLENEALERRCGRLLRITGVAAVSAVRAAAAQRVVVDKVEQLLETLRQRRRDTGRN
jgi:hypothetical protein